MKKRTKNNVQLPRPGLSQKMKIKPFIKWVGGKRQLLSKIKEYLPQEFNTYFEPFVGGGALLFYLQPKKAVINDLNKDLTYAYMCFQNEKDYSDLTELLKVHEKNHSEEYFYHIRNLDRLPNFKDMSIADRATRLIYLNRACFNGLYRVNKCGYNNVPSGKKISVCLYDEEIYFSIRQFFSNSSIEVRNIDFAEAVKDTQKNDFVYFDPPYDSYPDKNGFANYNSEKFNKEEQIRLRDTVNLLTKKGVKVMVSNHNTEFINQIYSKYKIHVVSVKRLLSSKASGRGEVEEVIITNY